MNRLAHLVTRLYPSRWRRRYGAEVGLLIGDAGADLRMVADLFKGAVSMQLSSWSLPRLAAILGILGMLAGLGISLLEPTRYVARTELSFAGDPAPASARDWLQNQLLNRTYLAAVIQNPTLQVYEDLLKREPLQDVIEEMRRNTVIAFDGTNNISIEFAYPNNAKAALVARQMATDGVTALRQMAALNRYRGPQQPSLKVADFASLPTRPLRPAWWLTALAGLTLGLAIAFIFTAGRWLGGFRPQHHFFRSLLWRLALAGSLAGAALAWIIPYAPWLDAGGIIPIRWESHATLYDEGTSLPLTAVLAQASSRTSVAALTADPRLSLYRDALSTQGIDDVAEIVRRDVIISVRKPEHGERFIDLSFTCPERLQCQSFLIGIIGRIESEYNALVSRVSPIAARIQPTPGVTTLPFLNVKAVGADQRKPVLIGLLGGLLLAVLVSILRFHWTPDPDDLAPAPLQTSGNYGRSFRRIAPWMVGAGACAGMVTLLLLPARYTSNAMLSFDDISPSAAAALIENSSRGIEPRPQWQQVESDGEKTTTFSLRASSRDPGAAREVLLDLLGDVDRAMLVMRGAEEAEYEKIRAVFPITSMVLPVPTEFEYNPAANITVPELPSAIRADDIPWDDQRARPLPTPGYHAFRMNVIDTPNLPSHAEGLGWWFIAIGAASGLVCAAFLGLFAGFGDGLQAQQSPVVTDPSVS